MAGVPGRLRRIGPGRVGGAAGAGAASAGAQQRSGGRGPL